VALAPRPPPAFDSLMLHNPDAKVGARCLIRIWRRLPNSHKD
jgi:hypothetical protein